MFNVSTKMYSILAGVVVFHMVLFAVLIVLPGCRTTTSKQSVEPSADVVLPPTKEAVEAPYVPPAPPPPRKQVEVKEQVSMPKEVGATEYVVQKGDTLGAIARRHGVSVGELQDANKIKAGQKLVIPSAGHKAVDLKPKSTGHKETVHKVEKSAKAEALAPNQYVVQAGDSLAKIAAKHGVKVSELKSANKLTSDKIKIGQKLTIPEKSALSVKAKANSFADEAKEVTAKAQSKPADMPAVKEQVPAPASDTSSVPAAPAAIDSELAVQPSAASPVDSSIKGQPQSDPSPVPASSPSPSVSDSRGYSFEHVVRPDDDINKIARMYAVKAEDIVALNNLGTNTKLSVGQKIKIPNL